MPGNTGTPAAAGPSCAQAADHTIDLLAKGQPDAPPDLVKKIRDTLASHCEKDAWSTESRTCFANMQTKEDGDRCENGLTDAQRKALNAEDPAEGSSGGGSRGGPHKGGDPCDGGE